MSSIQIVLFDFAELTQYSPQHRTPCIVILRSELFHTHYHCYLVSFQEMKVSISLRDHDFFQTQYTLNCR